MTPEGLPDARHIAQMNDINLLWLIFAVLAVVLPVYYGFKKSIRQGVINTAIAGAVLFFYFYSPSFEKIISIVFAAYIGYALIGLAWENLQN